MILGQSNFLQALGWAVLNSLWQMALLWVAYQFFTGLFRKASSSQKSLLASSIIMIGFSWFIFSFISALIGTIPGNRAISSVIVDTGNNVELNDWLHTMLPAASLIYLVFLILPVFYFLRNYRYVNLIRQSALSKVDVEWRIFVQNVAARMGIKKSVHIWLSGFVTTPVTIGYFKPVILLPLAVINNLSTQQMEAILLHELAHIRRYDYLMNLIIRFIQAVLYFNPFIKALVKSVEKEREMSCDKIVMQFQYDPYGYASALLTLEKVNHLPKTLAVAASGRKSDLFHRIESMFGVQKKQAISFNKLAGVLASLLFFITFNALLIVSRPSKNQYAISSLTHLSSPFYFFTGNVNEPATLPASGKIPSGAFVNTVKAYSGIKDKKNPAENKGRRFEKLFIANTKIPSPFMNVAFTEAPAIPELKEYQETQVKEVMETTRKVLEEKKWKVVENKIADVMTAYEKSLVKNQYEKEMSKVNWNKMEDKLRVAYHNIEWNKVNEALNKALTEIKIDSLHQAYTKSMVELSSLQQQLYENDLKGIPDSDISLKSVERSKKEVQKAISNLIKVKSKKIIHL